MQVGEAPLESVTRKVEEETNLGIVERDRFKFVGTYSTCFTSRKQSPQSNGLHSINLTYSLILNDLEAQAIQLTSLEYETWEWLSVDQLPQFFQQPNILDQALLQVLRDSLG